MGISIKRRNSTVTIAKWIAICGAIATLIGPAAEYASEASHFRFEYPYALLDAFPIGILATLIASIVWARLVDGPARKRASAWFFFAPIGINIGGSWIEPINVHGPGMFLVLATIVWWLLALVLLIMSAYGRPRVSAS